MTRERAGPSGGWSCRMSDGRLFTDYRPRCDIQLEFQSPMSGSYEYRQWLITNGRDIQKFHRSIAEDRAAYCEPCKSPLPIGTMVPESDHVVCDKLGCSRVKDPSINSSMLTSGTGRAYGSLPETIAMDRSSLTRFSRWHQCQ